MVAALLKPHHLSCAFIVYFYNGKVSQDIHLRCTRPILHPSLAEIQFFLCNPAHKATDKQTDDGEKLKVTLVVIVFLEINTICIIAFVAIYHYCNGRNII